MAQKIVACAAEQPSLPPGACILKAAEKLLGHGTETHAPIFEGTECSTTVVFVASKLDGRLKVAKHDRPDAVVVDCSPLPESALLLAQTGSGAGRHEVH